MPNSILLMSFGASLVLMVADELPNFNVEASCKAFEGFGLALSHSTEACVNDEKAAQAQLKQNWTSYPPAERSRCVAETMVGDPSYVDVLTCLQMAQDVDVMNTPLLGASKLKLRIKSGSPPHR
ncbi:MAG: hypothetical protein WB822_03060 [Rhodoplanes sp.]|jgi:hypothetical protein